MNYGYEDLEKRNGVPYKMLVNGIEETPYHWHNELEILLVARGAVIATVDGQKNKMEEDDLMIINPNCLHSTILDYTSSSVVLGIQLDPCYYDRFLQDFSKRHYLCKSFLHSRSFDVRTDPIRGAVARMFLQYSLNGAAGRLNCLAISNLLSSYIYTNIPWEDVKNQGTAAGEEDRERINEILAYLREHADEKITLDEIAEIQHINKYYLSHFFKEKVGIGFKKYLLNIRLDQGAELLLSTGHNVTYIANECGFSNQTSFFDLFKKRYGCLPAEFRMAHEDLGERHKCCTELDHVICQKLTEYVEREQASLDCLLTHDEKRTSFVSLMHHNT